MLKKISVKDVKILSLGIFLTKLLAGNGSILIQHSGQSLQQGQGQQGLNHQTQQNLQHSQIQVSTYLRTV